MAAKKSSSKDGGGNKPPKAPKTQKRASGGGGGGGGGDGGGNGGAAVPGELDASLEVEARRRYLNYALSVITSRALPDVRDGLKPVQRRILYAMLHDNHLRPDAKHRKSATVVGNVLGKYHPHGDSSVYDAMVRMAQEWVLRVPFVDGSGNFGSLDGDEAAAYRYTECRLAPPAMELLRELDFDTVDMRANYDGTTEEPTVLPARFPNLLVNGSTGIAVGMATNIPPHNLREITAALIALAEKRDIDHVQLMKHIEGPDFPTGGQLLNTKVELRQIYKDGQGTIRVRGEYKLEEKKRGGTDIVITSIPYAMSKADLVEKIADVIISRKLPYLLDIRDESTTDVRIVLEIKKDVDPELVMAYLYKQTPLQANFHVNLTCLVPPEFLDGKVPSGSPPQPKRMGIKEMLEHFLDFRLIITQRRFEYQLRQLEARIHILEGFATVFDALDELIKIIRASDGKEDAAGKIIKRFKLDEIQTDAILELKLYKLAKLEINVIREELATKTAEAKKIKALLKSEEKLWAVVKDELKAVAAELGTPRRTKTGGGAEEVTFDADAFIVDEDANIVVTRDGWIKRVRELKDPNATRTREGDAVAHVLPGSTKEKVIFFTNRGSAYVIKINDIPATTGYGDPAQKYFKFADGEKIVSAMTLDPRAMVPPTLLAMTKRGYGLRFASTPHTEITTKAGRRYAKLQEGDEILGVVACNDGDVVVAATRNGYVLHCKADEVAKLENPGRGVTVIKTADDDAVIGFIAGRKADQLKIETEKSGKKFELSADPKQVKGRGGKGHQVMKRVTFIVIPTPVTIQPLANAEGGQGVN
ncbi:MAG: DNA topoisomerase IV subunit A [Deltaproteobacteria bacterium]|nr:DNA topoisomerase IV subunit A [Deltaproteobacteria bacterium]MDQ3300218.1 DNA topoisomerase IV subunit A [Myxococcota bacterium]